MSKNIPSSHSVDSVGVFQVSFGRISCASRTSHLTCHQWCTICIGTNTVLRLQSMLTKISVSSSTYLIIGCSLSKFLAEKKKDACDQSHMGEGGQIGSFSPGLWLRGPQICSCLILKLMSKQARMR
jgi:hypothetical protein